MTLEPIGPGRPSKFTQQARAAILRAVRAGNSRRTAAAVAGVGSSTLASWVSQGRQEDEGEFREFLNDLEKAEARAVVSMVSIVRKAAEESWQAAAWWLERRFPDEWGRKDRVAVEHILQAQARVMAEQLGLDEGEIIADASRILSGLN